MLISLLCCPKTSVYGCHCVWEGEGWSRARSTLTEETRQSYSSWLKLFAYNNSFPTCVNSSKNQRWSDAGWLQISGSLMNTNHPTAPQRGQSVGSIGFPYKMTSYAILRTASVLHFNLFCEQLSQPVVGRRRQVIQKSSNTQFNSENVGFFTWHLSCRDRLKVSTSGGSINESLSHLSSVQQGDNAALTYHLLKVLWWMCWQTGPIHTSPPADTEKD